MSNWTFELKISASSSPTCRRAPVALVALGADCEILLDQPRLWNLNRVTVFVDCERIEYADPTYPPVPAASWHYDDNETPTAAVLNRPLCEALWQDGFERVDIVGMGCDPVF